LNLEGKIANWVELGTMPLIEARKLQDKLVELRAQGLIVDTILSVQHPLTVSFGNDGENNAFSQELLAKVLEEYGSSHSSFVERYLTTKEVPMITSKRSGGATVFAPGQYVFYPIVDHTQVTDSHKLDIKAYKSKIYAVMFDALRDLGVNGINTGSAESFKTRQERRDVWVNREGATYKMGSKGVALHRNIAYDGFVLHIDKAGIAHNWMVNQCGYKPHEVRLWSVEQELGKRPSPEEVYASVQRAIAKNFGYGSFRMVNYPREILEASA